MIKVAYIISIVSFFLTTNVKGADGCLISGTAYTSQVGTSNVFLETPSNGPSVCYTGTLVGTCEVCIGGILTINLPPLASVCLKLSPPYGFTSGSQYSNYTVVDCNLDDYSWTLGAAAGLFGVFVIRRRNKL